MTTSFGGQSMTWPLRKVLVKRPEACFSVDDIALWNYTSQPDYTVAQQEHDHLADILRNEGVEVVYHTQPQPERADAIFVHDPGLVTDAGAVILRMGKSLRVGEEEALAAFFEQQGIPILHRLSEGALAEGGDILWLDESTLLVGKGFRTNAQGISELKEVLGEQGIEVLSFDLPYCAGPRACLHLQSLISFVDEKLAVVYEPLMPVAFWQLLRERGVNLLPICEDEYHRMATNILATSPKRCVMLEGNPRTQALLAEAGCHVYTYRGEELSLKAEGGPTCLTRPLLRVRA